MSRYKANYEEKEEVEQVVAEENAELMMQIIDEVQNEQRAILRRLELVNSQVKSLKMTVEKEENEYIATMNDLKLKTKQRKNNLDVNKSELKLLELRYSSFCNQRMDELKRFKNEASHLRTWFAEIVEKHRLIKQLKPAFIPQNHYF
ncbi:uncharacterized protein LOC133798730 [Humulus lupulus]|uniref:uncharacterized protein LOC133798730 n=1 Tax=Humulus lupulus TaxID=3486 RepID=UPI002B402EB1|nr:uncharacterized protein LOC133798730 [Humulus lupulus]XP_062093170.1 uncharacterized protein LOC133798730 [Humulus lupulus]